MNGGIAAAVSLIVAASAVAQNRGPGDFQLTRINRNLVAAPQFTYTGAQQYATDQRSR